MTDKEKERRDLNKTAAYAIALVLIVVLCIVVSSCRTIRVEGGTHRSDSVRVEHRVDTFVQHTFDSVRIQLPCSDSIQVAYVDRYHTDTKYVRTLKHDTISVCKVDSVPYAVEVPVEVVRNSRTANFALWYMWMTLAAGAIIIGAKAFKKYYLHI